MFLIYQIFRNFHYAPFIEIILLYLFGYYIDKRILNLISNPIKSPCSYSFKWSFSNFWDDYPDLVAKHAEIQFSKKHKSSNDLFDESEEKPNEIDKKKKKKENNQNNEIIENIEKEKIKQGSSIQITKIDSIKKSIFTATNYLDFRNYFKSDILKYESEHRRLTRALGFLTIEKLHDSEEIIGKSPMDLSKETFGKLMNFNSLLKEGIMSSQNKSINENGNDEDFLKTFEKNEFRETLISFLRVFFI